MKHYVPDKSLSRDQLEHANVEGDEAADAEGVHRCHAADFSKMGVEVASLG